MKSTENKEFNEKVEKLKFKAYDPSNKFLSKIALYLILTPDFKNKD